MQKIVITDGVAMLVEETTHDIVPVEDFRRAISRNSVTTPLLPVGTVYYSEDSDKTVIAVIRRAEVREMNQANRVFTVAMPHRLYTVIMKNGGIRTVKQHFMLDLPTSMETRVYQAPFPNRTLQGDICASGVMFASQDECLVFRIDHVVNQVERTRHNTDHISYAKEAMPRDFREGADGQFTRMLDRWAAWTQRHEEDWQSSFSEIEWRDAGAFGDTTDIL